MVKIDDVLSSIFVYKEEKKESIKSDSDIESVNSESSFFSSEEKSKSKSLNEYGKIIIGDLKSVIKKSKNEKILFMSDNILARNELKKKQLLENNFKCKCGGYDKECEEDIEMVLIDGNCIKDGIGRIEGLIKRGKKVRVIVEESLKNEKLIKELRNIGFGLDRI